MNFIQPVTRKWKTKDGRKIRMCDMDDRHLLNSIAMLERKAAEELAAMWNASRLLQGEFAIETFDGEIERAEQDGPYRFRNYGYLIQERDRRELNA